MRSTNSVAAIRSRPTSLLLFAKGAKSSRASKQLRQGLPSQHAQHDLDEDQTYDNGCKRVRLCSANSVNKQLVKLRSDVKLLHNLALPLVQKEPLGCDRVHSRKINITDQFQDILASSSSTFNNSSTLAVSS